MKPEGERLEGHPVPARDVRPQFARPEPAHAKPIVDERRHRVGGPELADPDRPVRNRRRNGEGFPVAPGNDQVPLVCGDENLFRLRELEVDVREQALQPRLIADPHGAFRQGIRSVLDHVGTPAGNPFHITGEVVRRLVDFFGRILRRHDDGCRRHPLRHPDELAARGKRPRAQKTCQNHRLQRRVAKDTWSAHLVPLPWFK